ncbi:MAG: dockerin type I domain-containing protein [Ignavibacteriota bacterium]
MGYVTFAMAPSFGTAATPVSFTHCESADRLNNPLSTGCASGSVAPMSCDVTGDGATGATDVRAVMNEALGIAPAVHDLNQDGVVNVADIQRVALAAMGSGCVY